MFKVMTFNIRGFPHADGDNVWENRADLNVETILNAAPDLIGFQELMPGNHAHYEQTLTGYDYRLGPRVSMENPKRTWEHPAIYWRRDRYDLIDSGDLYLSNTPEQYALDWGAEQGRGLAWAHLKDQTDGAELVFMNTHFDHVSNDARVKSAQLVCRWSRERFPTLPVILTGDFNSMPLLAGSETGLDETPYSTFMDAGFQDVFTVAPLPASEPTWTFHGFVGEDFRGFEDRIDWTLYRDPSSRLKATATRIIRDAKPPIYPSDHYPIVATFTAQSS